MPCQRRVSDYGELKDLCLKLFEPALELPHENAAHICDTGNKEYAAFLMCRQMKYCVNLGGTAGVIRSLLPGMECLRRFIYCRNEFFQ